MQMASDNVQYTLWHRWEHDPQNNTWCTPSPRFTTTCGFCILFKESAVAGECHNIGAAMTLACRILGIGGKFEVGHMYPWPRRQEDPQKQCEARSQRLSHQRAGTNGRTPEPTPRPNRRTSLPASPSSPTPRSKRTWSFWTAPARRTTSKGSPVRVSQRRGDRGGSLRIGDAIFDRIKTSGSPPADETAVDKNATDYYTQRGANDATGRPTGLMPPSAGLRCSS